MSVIIEHVECAERLFATGQLPDDTAAALRLIIRQYRLHPDPADAIAVMATDFDQCPSVAAARMRACLQLAPDRLELPDALGPDALALIGCEVDECVRADSLTLVGRTLRCPDHHAAAVLDALLAESAGGDDDEH